MVRTDPWESCGEPEGKEHASRRLPHGYLQTGLQELLVSSSYPQGAAIHTISKASGEPKYGSHLVDGETEAQGGEENPISRCRAKVSHRRSRGFHLHPCKMVLGKSETPIV